jgi:MoaA/NifB/PqqE/SkfB family radical SAM enzyme
MGPPIIRWSGPNYSLQNKTMQTLDTLCSKSACRLLGSALDISAGPFPAVVRIETTNACNSRCTICPHRNLQRAIQHMPDELFTHIIDECAAGGCKEVHLHNFGEPLLDKQLEQRVRYAKAQGIKRVKIFSNGSLLTEARSRGLIEAGLDEIKISFDGATREEFEQIRWPLKFDEVVGNVKRLVELRAQMRSPLRVHVVCCSTSDKQATMESLEQLVDGFFFGKVHNWNGADEGGSNRTIRKPCSRLWRTFTILVNGDVALCCLDYNGQHLLGRVEVGTSLAGLWQGDVYRQVRRQHKRGRQADIRLCRNCTKSFL